MNARNIEVKALLNADEFVEYEAEREAADVKTSPLIRAFLNDWTAKQKLKRQRALREWPAYGQNMAMFPGRRGGIRVPLRV